MGVLPTDPQQLKLLYSYMGIRLLVYLFFFIITLSQSIIEGKILIKNKQSQSTRFFIFLSMAFFTGFRVVSACLFYKNPFLGVGSASFFFFSLGTISIFLQWVFVAGHWLLIMYSFFVSDEVKINSVNPIRYSTYCFSLVLIVYQITISTLTLFYDIALIESIGFLILLLIYASAVVINGSILLKNLHHHKKQSQYEGCFQNMIFKTKVLLFTLVSVFVIIVTEEILFMLVSNNTYETPRQYLKIFITSFVDTIQMFIVLMVIANGKFSNYIKFKKVKTTSLSSSEDSSSRNSYKNTKKTTPSNVSGKSLSLEVDMDSISYSIHSSNNDGTSKNSIVVAVIPTSTSLRSSSIPLNYDNSISENNIIISNDENHNLENTNEN